MNRIFNTKIYILEEMTQEELNELALERNTLQQRIDKAIKLLQLPLVYETNKIEDLERTNLTRINELLEILKGDNND
jgi:hypothetical protein